jgi:hypothetical protein
LVQTQVGAHKGVKMKSLFHGKYDSYLPEASELERKTTQAIKGIFIEYINSGYPVHEVEYVMLSAINMEASLERLNNSMAIIDAEKKKELQNI